MADAAEALDDMFLALHACFSEGSEGASSSSNTGAQAAGGPDEGFWSDSVVAKAFGLNVRESSRCSNCQYPMPSQSYTKCFQLVTTEVWINEWQAAEQGVEPETLLRRTYEKDIRCGYCVLCLCVPLVCVYVCVYIALYGTSMCMCVCVCVCVCA